MFEELTVNPSIQTLLFYLVPYDIEIQNLYNFFVHMWLNCEALDCEG